MYVHRGSVNRPAADEHEQRRFGSESKLACGQWACALGFSRPKVNRSAADGIHKSATPPKVNRTEAVFTFIFFFFFFFFVMSVSVICLKIQRTVSNKYEQKHFEKRFGQAAAVHIFNSAV